MKIRQRITALFLAAGITAALAVSGASASSFNPVVDTITTKSDSRISSLLTAIELQSFTSPTAEKVESLISYFIFDSQYSAIGGDAWPYTNDAIWTTCTDGKYTISGINGSGCFAYAKFVMNVIYDKTGDFLKEGEGAGAITASGLEAFLRANAQAGEHLRLGNIHSVVFISCDANGFYYLDTWSAYHVTLHYTTFEKFASACNESTSSVELGLYNANPNVNDVSKQQGDGSVQTGIVISPNRYPSGQLVKGNYFNLTGSITSVQEISTFIGTIYNTAGSVIQSRTEKSGGTYIDIASSEVNNLSFGSLDEGSYYLEYEVTDVAGTRVIWSSDTFSVTDAVSTLSINPESYPSGNFTPRAYDLTGTVTSNYNITSVAGFIDNENGDTLYTATILDINAKTFDIENSGIDNALKFGELTPGNYYLIYTASDTSGNSVTWRSPVITVSDSDDGEDGGETDAITIHPTSYPTGNISAKAFTLRGTISSSGSKLTSVTGSIVRANGTVSQTVTESVSTGSFDLSGSTIDSNLKFGQLGAGYYKLVYQATNSGGITETWTSPVFAVAGKTLFTDVTNSGDWYYNSVYAMADSGYLAGYDNGNGTYSYKPDNAVARVEAVSLLYQVYCGGHGTPDLTGKTVPFTDTVSGSWYDPALTWAYNAGVIAGTSATTFDPFGTLTREQFAVILYNYAVYNGYDTSASADLSAKFTDADEVSDFAKTAMPWANAKGLINGMGDGTIKPKGAVSRAQAATILWSLTKNGLA